MVLVQKRLQKLVQCSVMFWYPYLEGMPEIYCGEDCNISSQNLVTTLDRGQPIPRLLVPNAPSLSLTRQICMATTRDDYKSNKKLDIVRHEGQQLINITRLSFDSRIMCGNK